MVSSWQLLLPQALLQPQLSPQPQPPASPLLQHSLLPRRLLLSPPQ